MKTRWSIATTLSLALVTSSSLALEVETLRDSGPVDSRFNIVVLGDGYTATDQDKLTSDANTLIDIVFETAPFAQYQALFNVKLLHVISNETGADNGSYGAMRDTALGARFLCNGIDRLLCIDDTAVYSLAATDVPEFNLALVVVNDPKRGGSGDNIAVTSFEPNSLDVIVHELGHTLAKLADEYSDPYPGYPQCSQVTDCSEANVTLRSTREELKWNVWVEASTPIVTPATNGYASVVGAFEGARYQTTGVFRPWHTCKMRSSDRPFCPVCNEHLIKTFWNLENIRMVEDRTPDTSPLTIDTCDPVDLTLTTPPLALDFAWTLDGNPVGTSTNTLTLLPEELGSGSHQVGVVVQDPTTQVRLDPNQLLSEELAWDLEVLVDDCNSTSGSGGATMGGMGGSGGGGSSVGGNSGAGGVSSGGGSGGLSSTGGSGGSSGGSEATGGAGGSGGNGGSSATGGVPGTGGSAGMGNLTSGGGTSGGGDTSNGGTSGTSTSGGAAGAPATSGGGITNSMSNATSSSTVTASMTATTGAPAPKANEKGGCSCSVVGEPTRPAPLTLLAPLGLLLLGWRRGKAPTR